MASEVSSELTDEELLHAMVDLGGDFVRTCQERQANVGKIQDDPRWTLSVLPLRFESQLHVLLLGAIDAFDVVAGLLRARASQQVFNVIRFQTETLAVIRWMVDSKDHSERQWRAYRVLCGQLARQSTLLLADAVRAPAEARSTAERAQAAARHLEQLMKEDGYPGPKRAPDRRYLYEKYLDEGGYEAFGMYSELGSHPGGAGHILFALTDKDSGEVSFDLGQALVLRAFWAGVSLWFLHKTVVEVGLALGWRDWLESSLPSLVRRMETLIEEAVKRKQGAKP
jgi:hypothetical protein